MNVIRCKNGHFFDGDSYDACPHCGELVVSGSENLPKAEKKGFWGKGRKEKEGVQCNRETPPAIACDSFGKGDTATDCCGRDYGAEKASCSPRANPTLDFWQTSAHPDHDSEETSLESAPIENADGGCSDKQKTVKSEEDTEMISKGTSSLQDVVRKASASSEGKTMSYFSAATGGSPNESQHRQGTEPVVGWLVCVAGPHFGECFCIYAGKNSVGRGTDNRIVIADDNTISRSKHALIVYEPKKRNFYLQPGDSSGLTYLNDEYITESHKLCAYDTVEMGGSKFVFVPLCSEFFSWEDYINKGE